MTNTENNNNQEIEIDRSKRVVAGTVKDASGTLPGVSVLIKGTTRGGETDFDGKYVVNAEENDILVFSYLGYETKEITIGNSNTINIVLVEGGEVLEEVVVASAYSIKRKAVSHGVVQSLMGRVSGVAISGNSAGVNVVVRGISTISQTDPVYIVDGIPTNNNPMSTLNPDDIDSIQSIKASDASKIYGNKAPNGIIIITTKEGKKTNKKAIDDLETMIKETVELKAWDPKTPYLKILKKRSVSRSSLQKILGN